MELSAIMHSTVAVIYQALHYNVLFLVECGILIPIPSFLLIIIVRVFQLPFHICGLPGHVISAKTLLMDIKEQSLTMLHTLLLCHINICVYVHGDLCENLIHQNFVDLECSSLKNEIDSI